MCINLCNREEVQANYGLLNMIIPRQLTRHVDLPRYYCLIRVAPAYRTNDYSLCGFCYRNLLMMEADVRMYEEANYHSICGVSGRARVLRCDSCEKRIGRLIPADECRLCAEQLPILTTNQINSLAQGKLVRIDYHP